MKRIEVSIAEDDANRHIGTLEIVLESANL